MPDEPSSAAGAAGARTGLPITESTLDVLIREGRRLCDHECLKWVPADLEIIVRKENHIHSKTKSFTIFLEVDAHSFFGHVFRVFLFCFVFSLSYIRLKIAPVTKMVA